VRILLETIKEDVAHNEVSVEISEEENGVVVVRLGGGEPKEFVALDNGAVVGGNSLEQIASVLPETITQFAKLPLFVYGILKKEYCVHSFIPVGVQYSADSVDGYCVSCDNFSRIGKARQLPGGRLEGGVWDLHALSTDEYEAVMKELDYLEHSYTRIPVVVASGRLAFMYTADGGGKCHSVWPCEG